MVDRLFAFFEHAPAGFKVVARDWSYVYVNPAGAAVLGKRPDEMIGKRVWDLFPEAVGTTFWSAYHRVMAGGAPEFLEDHYEALGRTYEIHVYPCPEGVAVHFRDVTNSRRREALLRQALADLEHAGELGRLGSWALDLRTGLVTLSPMAARLFQRAADAGPLQLAALAEWFRPEDRAAVESGLRRASVEGVWVEIDVVAVRPDDTRFDAHLVGEPVRDPAGAIVGLAGSVQDITARRRAEEERRRLEERVQHAARLESLAVLAGGVAHDFNNLLMGILGHVQLALGDAPPPEPFGHLTHIERAALSAADLTRQLLAYAGRTRFRPGPVDLASLVEEMAAHIRSVAPRVQVTVDRPDGLPPVLGDATHLRQVLHNLLDNACEALGPAGGSVRLRISGTDLSEPLAAAPDQPELPAGTYVRVEVVDDGPGIPADTLSRVFEPFFTTRFAGRGLGLSTALGVVRSHRGRIAVESGAAGGTSVTFHLPVVPRSAPAPEASVSDLPPLPASRGVVLVVDDEPIVRGVTVRILKKAGYAVLEAASGEDALAALGSLAAPPDAALLDLTLPGMDGVTLAAAIRGRLPLVRVVLMTGYGDAETVEAASRAGVRAVLQKPFRTDDLLRVLNAAEVGPPLS